MTAVFTYNYNSAYIPAMPMAELLIGRPMGDATVVLTAVVDSGADATMIPMTYLRQIHAPRSGQAWMRGIASGRTRVNMYAVALQLGPYRQGYMEVIAGPDSDEAIIGRDVLNHLLVTFNGPASVVEVT